MHREALGGGDEQEGWRAALRAEALTGVGRAEEAEQIAAWATGGRAQARALWSLPLSLLAQGRARAALQRDDAREPLDEAAALAERSGAVPILEAIEEERAAISTGARYAVAFPGWST